MVIGVLHEPFHSTLSIREKARTFGVMNATKISESNDDHKSARVNVAGREAKTTLDARETRNHKDDGSDWVKIPNPGLTEVLREINCYMMIWDRCVS